MFDLAVGKVISNTGRKNRMILSNYFVFIHFPKTGGTFFRELCRKYAPSKWEVKIVEDHPTINDIPAEYKNLPILGFVRNPFDWYVSWYNYLKSIGSNEFFNKVSEQGTKDFKNTMLTIFEINVSEFFGFDCVYYKSSYGCYLNYTFGNDLDALYIGKFESLRTDLLSILDKIGVLNNKLQEQILNHPVVNKSEHEHYRKYYDQELKNIIYQRDKEILDKFGYSF